MSKNSNLKATNFWPAIWSKPSKSDQKRASAKDLGEPEPVLKNNVAASTHWEADETNAQEPNRTTKLPPIRPKQAQTV
jgi:hypothetical protein